MAKSIISKLNRATSRRKKFPRASKKVRDTPAPTVSVLKNSPS